MVLAGALPLSACASQGNGPYRLVTDTHHGPMIGPRFQTREACERVRSSEERCATARELRSRH